MSFVLDVLEAVVDVVVFIVEAVVQVVEMIVQLIMVLFGLDTGSTQIIEYYEVHNIPLFDDVDKKNPLLNSILSSILAGQDVASNLIYHLTFRSLKGNVKEFMDFIDNGNYFENFPTVESYILTIDYTELTAALNTLNSVPCTPEGSYLRALSKSDWVKYWLQENKEYNVGTNTIGVDHSTTSTSPASVAADTVNVTPSTNHFDISITSGIATADEVFADERWQVNLDTIVYNAIPDTYTIQVYNAPTVGSITRTLPYTAPTKPTQLHYVSNYYRDSAPSRIYLFIYKVGTGVYTDLDTVENAIDQDGTTIEALPAIPLRLSNASYTTFGATKQAQIEDLLARIHLDPAEVLNTIITKSSIAANDLDHVYVNFGVRMWDTSQAGMSYLFKMFENLYPSQGITQGTYNNTAAGDVKPQNNILVTTDDNKLAFQWSYITYTHTSLAAINADSGSTENGIYYSDMSKFVGGILVYDYYVSSGKGMYNVGYKADTLVEVAAFLAGNGTTNPGTTSTEAANWLQVTERMSYNNPSPSLLESDGTAATLKYLTPDLVYENNGSGVLKLLEQASPETTIGQSITYYCVKPSGLDAYTVVSPIGACRVVDGSSGHFRIVKFNLGNKGDLMVPFFHTFIKDLSNDKVARLFLAGCHASIYVAHYEKIVQEGMSWLTALVMIVIIVVVAYYAYPMLKELFGAMTAIFAEMAAAATLTAALSVAVGALISALPTMLLKLAAQYVIQLIITEIAGDNPELAMILNLIATVAIAAWNPGVGVGAPAGTFGTTGGATIGMGGGSLNTLSTGGSTWGLSYTGMSINFSDLNAWDYAEIAIRAIGNFGEVMSYKANTIAQELAVDYQNLEILQKSQAEDQAGWNTFIEANTIDSFGLDPNVLVRAKTTKYFGAEVTYAVADAYCLVQLSAFEYSKTIESKCSIEQMIGV